MKPPAVGKCRLTPPNESSVAFLSEATDLRPDLLSKRLLREVNDQLLIDLNGYLLAIGGKAIRQAAMMPRLISMALLQVISLLKTDAQAVLREYGEEAADVSSVPTVCIYDDIDHTYKTAYAGACFGQK